jgi:hypothetical protein
MSDWEVIEPEKEWEVASNNVDSSPNAFMSFLGGIEKAGGDLGHGILQPLLESGILGEIIKRNSQDVGRERLEKYNQYEKANPLSAKAGNITGNIGLALPGMFLGGSGASGLIPKAPGYLRALASILGYGGSGALSGASQYVNPRESRLENAVMGGGIGLGAGALGTAIKGGLGLGKAIKKAYPAEKVSEKILKDRSNILKKYNDSYEDLFKVAENEGINKISVPHINSKSIKKNTTSKEYESLENFFESPTLKNAHRAQSDLGRTIRRLQKTHEGVGLNTSQQQALESALMAQKKIRGSIFQELSKNGKNDLSKEYSKLTTGYAKEVLPYTKSVPINKFKRGELTSEDFLKSLNNNKKFKAQLGEKYPELETRRKISSTLRHAVPIGGAASLLEALHLMGKL